MVASRLFLGSPELNVRWDTACISENLRLQIELFINIISDPEVILDRIMNANDGRREQRLGKYVKYGNSVLDGIRNVQQNSSFMAKAMAEELRKPMVQVNNDSSIERAANIIYDAARRVLDGKA
ncbi:MAG: hypothetical protein KGH61_04375 [Candidatus Micrarchaeota archaeon]|nr:hypothetical protein [Candidatus Micrarchaeota archaeon]MDE1848154.1 hypothetical protein [Candidatus Micrarchaeota archaeon]MDE1864114.1 hypothetical protein [Candidatus Micrarchaeota archaeon]